MILIKVLLKLPQASYWWLRDLYHCIRERWYLRFERWGLHLFVGMFGAGKTSTMVYYALQLARQYKQLHILTNIDLYHFPKWTKILRLRCLEDIYNAPENTLVLIDEIGTIFNSRDFSKKDALPKALFQHLCQCRKRHLMIYATTQRWNFLDKQLRDITDTVYSSRIHFPHPFSRLCVVRRYDAQEYDLAYNNPLYPIRKLSSDVYVQTDRLRDSYSTEQLIDGMLSSQASDWLSDEEIAQNRGELHREAFDVSAARVKPRRGKRKGFKV